MPSAIYVLEVQTGYFNSRVILNGVPIFAENTGKFLTSQTKINQWIVEGTNKLEVFLKLPLSQVDLEELSPSRKFQLKLILGEQGREPGPEGNLILYEWNSEQTEVSENMSLVFSSEFQPSKTFGRWLWQDTSNIQLTPEDRAQIIQIIKRFHGSLAAKDIGSLSELFSTFTDEMAKAIGISKGELLQDQREFFQSLFSTPEWKMEELNESLIQFVIIAEGKLVQAKGIENRLLLNGRGKNRLYSNNLTFGKIKGDWRIFPESN